jgi:hypothetical protein
MDGPFIVSLIAAFGLGSLLTALVQSWLSRRVQIEDRNFGERKEAYIGLLSAYHKAAVEGTDAAAKEFAYWQMRCELVAPQKVREAIERIISTNDERELRYEAHDQLKEALRADLGVVRRA